MERGHLGAGSSRAGFSGSCLLNWGGSGAPRSVLGLSAQPRLHLLSPAWGSPAASPFPQLEPGCWGGM